MNAGYPSMSVGFELVDHTADIGVRAWGPTAEEVFEQAALATFSLVCDPLDIGELETVEVTLEAESMDLLLAAWINELLYVFEARGLVLSQFDLLELGDHSLRARVSGEPLDTSRHIVCGGVKAATLHELSLQRRDDGWEGFVLLDV
jgi:SHS2 domain-containing protein